VEDDRSLTIGQAGATLTFHSAEPHDQSVGVSLDLPGFVASTRVFVDYPEIGGDLADFFRVLEADWKGWDGPREWSTPESDFRLTCWHDRIGHVSVRVDLGRDPVREWPHAQWKVTAIVIVDPGALSVIAMELRELFEGG
jgi:hypothetical protein